MNLPAPHNTHAVPQSLPQAGCHEILQPCPDQGWPVSPWKKRAEIARWMNNNRSLFSFSRDGIIAQFVRYEGVRPGPDLPGIYILGLSQDIGYAGKSSSITKRLWSHWSGDKIFTHYWCLTGIPREVIDEVEGFFIDLLEPPMNIAQGRSSEGLRGLADEIKARYCSMSGPRYPDPRFRPEG